MGLEPRSTIFELLHASYHLFPFIFYSVSPFFPLFHSHPPLLSLSPKFHWILGSAHRSQEPGVAFERETKPLDNDSKFRINQGCSCSRRKQGSNFAVTALKLEKGPPQGAVCKYGNVMVPVAANENTAVSGEASQQDPQARIQASRKCALCFPQVARRGQGWVLPKAQLYVFC